MRPVIVILILSGLLGGCTRAWYRRDADRETYPAVREHITDPAWSLPRISINTDRQSRLYDPFDPDHPPMPPDDPAADRFMRRPNGIRGYGGWHKDGDAPWIEDPDWKNFLELSDKGILVLTPEKAVEIGLQNSREYQNALEDLYLTALQLTLDRFEFALHWFGGNATTYTQAGSSGNESDTLNTTSTLGFTRALATGGQLLVDFANTFVFQYAGPDSRVASSNIVVNFLQPLLRGAGRKIALEALTQSERNVLYAARDFARFRKTFYANITTRAGGFLSLLSQVQSIRNLQANLLSLERNLEVHNALLATGSVSEVQVDQVFQQLQQGQVSLLIAQTSLDNALDNFKIALGLSPNVPISLDDSLLAPFQLADPALEAMQKEVESFAAEYRQLPAAPTLAKLRVGFNRLRAYQARTLKLADQVNGEMDRWKAKLPASTARDAGSAYERATYQRVARELAALRADIVTLAKDINKSSAALTESKRNDGWENLNRLVRKEDGLRQSLFVQESQVRVFLIELRPVQYEESAATEFALANRLDLMNQQGRVVDAWRQITVTADRLKSDLNVVFNANLNTLPGGTNPFDFRSSANSYSVGFQFQGPLNRQAERNIYRASLVNYERVRRAYMALDDQIQQAIRRDLRSLQTDRLNFAIARQSTAGAARAVEGAYEQLLQPGQNQALTNSTQNVLIALGNLLTAKNTLIGSWVSYEQDRIQLLLDLEALQLNEQGLYVDEYDHKSRQSSAGRSGPDQPSSHQGSAAHKQSEGQKSP